MRVDEHTIDLAGQPLFYRTAPATFTPTLYLHGVPTSSRDWSAVLERTGGVAPDLPGFGRSGKAGHLDYSLSGFADVLEQLLATLAIERFQLVGHGWGAAAGLALAQRQPARVERIVFCNPLAPLGDLQWSRLARIYRTRALGELAMGFTTKRLLRRTIRRGCLRAEAFSNPRIEEIWHQFDQGTQRAILMLHRSVDEARVDDLGAVGAPTLIIWGEGDPWLGPALAERLATALPDAELRRVPDAGHWPWLDRPELIESICSFLGVR